MEWHHIIERSQILKSFFSPFRVNHTNNVIAIPRPVHKEISKYYSRIHDFTEGKTYRNWLAGQSFTDQYNSGLDVLRHYGVIE